MALSEPKKIRQFSLLRFFWLDKRASVAKAIRNWKLNPYAKKKSSPRAIISTDYSLFESGFTSGFGVEIHISKFSGFIYLWSNIYTVNHETLSLILLQKISVWRKWNWHLWKNFWQRPYHRSNFYFLRIFDKCFMCDKLMFINSVYNLCFHSTSGTWENSSDQKTRQTSYRTTSL